MVLPSSGIWRQPEPGPPAWPYTAVPASSAGGGVPSVLPPHLEAAQRDAASAASSRQSSSKALPAGGVAGFAFESYPAQVGFEPSGSLRRSQNSRSGSGGGVNTNASTANPYPASSLRKKPPPQRRSSGGTSAGSWQNQQQGTHFSVIPPDGEGGPRPQVVPEGSRPPSFRPAELRRASGWSSPPPSPPGERGAAGWHAAPPAHPPAGVADTFRFPGAEEEEEGVGGVRGDTATGFGGFSGAWSQGVQEHGAMEEDGSEQATLDLSVKRVRAWEDPKNLMYGVGIFVFLVLAVFGAIAIAAVSRSDPENSDCFGDGRRYVLQHEFTTASGDGFAVELKNIKGIAQRGDYSFAVSYEGSSGDSASPPIVTMVIEGTALRAVKAEGDKLFSAPRNLVVQGAVATHTSGSVWVTDTSLQMVVKLSSTHGSGVALAVGRHGSAGSDNHTFDEPSDVAISGDNVFVLDANNCRVKVLSVLGAFVHSIGECGRLLGAVGLAATPQHVYVATNRGIVVYTWATGGYVTTYGLTTSSDPLDHLRDSLSQKYWKFQINSLSHTPHTGHLLATERGQVVMRTLQGDVRCNFGDADSPPVGVVMLSDRRLVVAEEDRIKVYALSA